MTEPAECPEGVPIVTLAGKKWPIPELAIRQLRIVRRLLIDLTDAIAQTEDETTGQRVMRLSSEHYAQMTEVVYQGLTRAHPKLDRDTFLDMPCTDMEMFLAFLVVRRQSGLFVARPPDAEGKSQLGEAPAGLSSTGTE